MPGSNCSALYCNTSREKHRISLFKFPKEKECSEKWLQNVGRRDLLEKDTEYLHHNHKICALHFEKSSFMNDKTRNKLTPSAIPTIFPKDYRQTLKRNDNCAKNIDSSPNERIPDELQLNTIGNNNESLESRKWVLEQHDDSVTKKACLCSVKSIESELANKMVQVGDLRTYRNKKVQASGLKTKKEQSYLRMINKQKSKIKRMQLQIRKLNDKLASASQKQATNFLSEIAADILDSEFKLRPRKARGQRYTTKIKSSIHRNIIGVIS